jgi:hypothetical protein
VAASVERRRRWPLNCSVVFALMVAPAQMSLAQDVPRIACIVANADTGVVSGLRDFPRGGMLIAAEKGLFVARAVNGAVTVAAAGTPDTGDVLDMRGFPGGGVLIRAAKGWFLARAVNGAVTVAPAGTADTGAVFGMGGFPGLGMLIQAAKGWFLARAVDGADGEALAVLPDLGRGERNLDRR